MAPHAATLFRQWVMLIEQYSRAGAIMQAGIKRDIISAPSLSYTWARRGQHPAVKTSGKRQGDKVFGAMAYCSGRLYSQGLEGRFASDSDPAF